MSEAAVERSRPGGRATAPTAAALVFGLFVVIVALDWTTGASVTLRSLLFLPVGLAAWMLGRFAALSLALAAAAFVVYDDAHSGLAALVPGFATSDAIARLVSLTVVAELMVRIRQARAEAHDTASRLQSVLDTATDVAIVGCDPSGVITTCSAGAERLLGHHAGESLGAPVGGVTFVPDVGTRGDDDDAEAHGYEAIVGRAREGSADAREWTILRANGGARTVRMVVSADRDPTGRVAGFTCVAIDVTDKRRSEAAVRAKNEELRAFAYTVSHDLKAPLRGIAGYAQELQRKHSAGLSERALFCLAQVQVATTNLDRLIDDLLRYARLMREEVVREEVDLEAVVQSILRDHHATIEDTGAVVDVAMTVRRVHTWERAVVQILANLVDNALKYARASRPPIVRIESRRGEGDTIELRVADNGIGFDPRYAEHIFGLFNRLTQPAEYTGTGAGLTIVQRMAEKVGGSVRATSAPGQGATFVVELPAASLPDRQAGTEEERP